MIINYLKEVKDKVKSNKSCIGSRSKIIVKNGEDPDQHQSQLL